MKNITKQLASIGKTIIIIIAHRLSTIKDADSKIYAGEAIYNAGVTIYNGGVLVV